MSLSNFEQLVREHGENLNRFRPRPFGGLIVSVMFLMTAALTIFAHETWNYNTKVLWSELPLAILAFCLIFRVNWLWKYIKCNVIGYVMVVIDNRRVSGKITIVFNHPPFEPGNESVPPRKEEGHVLNIPLGGWFARKPWVGTWWNRNVRSDFNLELAVPVAELLEKEHSLFIVDKERSRILCSFEQAIEILIGYSDISIADILKSAQRQIRVINEQWDKDLQKHARLVQSIQAIIEELLKTVRLVRSIEGNKIGFKLLHSLSCSGRNDVSPAWWKQTELELQRLGPNRGRQVTLGH